MKEEMVRVNTAKFRTTVLNILLPLNVATRKTYMKRNENRRGAEITRLNEGGLHNTESAVDVNW